eukprot:2049992-Rhodomonas_salina.1
MEGCWPKLKGCSELCEHGAGTRYGGRAGSVERGSGKRLQPKPERDSGMKRKERSRVWKRGCDEEAKQTELAGGAGSDLKRRRETARGKSVAVRSQGLRRESPNGNLYGWGKGKGRSEREQGSGREPASFSSNEVIGNARPEGAARPGQQRGKE